MQLSQIDTVAKKLAEAKRRAIQADDHADLEQQIKDLSERLDRTLRSLRACRRERDRLRRQLNNSRTTGQPTIAERKHMTPSENTTDDKERAARATVARFKDAADRMHDAIEDLQAAYRDMQAVAAATCASLATDYGFDIDAARRQEEGKETTSHE